MKLGGVTCTLVNGESRATFAEHRVGSDVSRFVEIQPGARYEVHLESESMDRKVVALWVDGQKVFSNTYWLEPGDTLDIKGWPLTAKWPDVLHNVAPFRTGAVAASAGAGGGASAPSTSPNGSVTVAVYTVRRAADISTQVCSVGEVADASSTAPSADSKAALTQNMATQRPAAHRSEHVEVQHWEIDPAEPVQHFDFKYRDPEALHLERKRAGMSVGGMGGGGGTAAKAQGASGGAAGGGTAASSKSLFRIADDGVLELGDSDDEDAGGGAAAPLGGSVRPRDDGAMKPEPGVYSGGSPSKRARQSSSHDMLDLTGGAVRQSKALTVELYHETGGAVLTKLTPALVEAPAPGDERAARNALDTLTQQAEEYYRDALVGTPFLAAVSEGVMLLSAAGRAPITAWQQAASAAKHGIIVRPAKAA